MSQNPYQKRTLIFQGEGSLGAYEAGVFQAFWKYNRKMAKKEYKNAAHI
ncbi:MAG TPA: hypothetical protein VI278_04795 [Nitrososphaeraceae archaeon]